MSRIVDTDNFGGDYPPFMSREKRRKPGLRSEDGEPYQHSTGEEPGGHGRE